MNIIYSIIAPVYNERESLPELYRRVCAVMDSNGEPWELVLVDDGSTDGSTDEILALAKKDSRVRPIIFARNFGHQIAISAGMDHASGDAVDASFCFVPPSSICGVSRSGSTLTSSTLRSGTFAAFTTCASRASVVGQTSGQWVKPKKINVGWPLRLCVVNGRPASSTSETSGTGRGCGSHVPLVSWGAWLLVRLAIQTPPAAATAP